MLQKHFANNTNKSNAIFRFFYFFLVCFAREFYASQKTKAKLKIINKQFLFISLHIANLFFFLLYADFLKLFANSICAGDTKVNIRRYNQTHIWTGYIHKYEYVNTMFESCMVANFIENVLRWLNKRKKYWKKIKHRSNNIHKCVTN